MWGRFLEGLLMRYRSSSYSSFLTHTSRNSRWRLALFEAKLSLGVMVSKLFRNKKVYVNQSPVKRSFITFASGGRSCGVKEEVQVVSINKRKLNSSTVVWQWLAVYCGWLPRDILVHWWSHNQLTQLTQLFSSLSSATILSINIPLFLQIWLQEQQPCELASQIAVFIN